MYMAQINSVKDVGLWIKEERIRLGLTQRQLSGLVGVGERFLLELEKGKTTAEIGKVFQVLQKMGARLEINLRLKNESR
jgi:y4mF family transcriptional regulator